MFRRQDSGTKRDNLWIVDILIASSIADVLSIGRVCQPTGLASDLWFAYLTSIYPSNHMEIPVDAALISS